MNDQYFLLIDGKQQGPYTLEQLRLNWQMRQYYKMTEETLFCQEGMDEWIPLSAIADLLLPIKHNSGTTSYHRAVSAESDKRILPAFILWFFLGGVGAHRFYIGRPLTALLFPFLSISGIFLVIGVGNQLAIFGLMFLSIFGLWLLVDFISIVIGSMEDGNGRKISKWT